MSTHPQGTDVSRRPHGIEEGRGNTFILRDGMEVHAPIDRCFALSCSVAMVHEELGMSAVAGRTEGSVEGGDTVRWEGWQLGMKHVHVSHISGYERPSFLQDTMLEGRFKSFQHDHHLRDIGNGITLLQDEVRFSLPFGLAGRIVARAVVAPHIRNLMHSRFARIKRVAEGNGWREYLPAQPGIPVTAEVMQ